jgi:DNA-binding NtrC family response regulator
VARFGAEEGKRISRVSAEALSLLTSHRWPGNVRQLENAIFRAVVLAEGIEIDVQEFPQIAAHLARSLVPIPERALANLEPVEIAFAGDAPPLDQPTAGRMAPSPATSGAFSLPLLNETGEVRPLEDLETEIIRFAIAHYRGQMSEVARRLRIGRSTLYR